MYRTFFRVSVVAIVALFVSSVDVRAADEPVRALLKERLAVLKEIVKAKTASQVAGNADWKAVLEAHQEVARAKLELAETPAERIAALEESLAAAKLAEKKAASMYEAERIAKLELLEAKANRLRAEADLVKEKGNK